jgi:hypothetical protein
MPQIPLIDDLKDKSSGNPETSRQAHVIWKSMELVIVGSHLGNFSPSNIYRFGKAILYRQASYTAFVACLESYADRYKQC